MGGGFDFSNAMIALSSAMEANRKRQEEEQAKAWDREKMDFQRQQWANQIARQKHEDLEFEQRQKEFKQKSEDREQRLIDERIEKYGVPERNVDISQPVADFGRKAMMGAMGAGTPAGIGFEKTMSAIDLMPKKPSMIPTTVPVRPGDSPRPPSLNLAQGQLAKPIVSPTGTPSSNVLDLNNSIIPFSPGTTTIPKILSLREQKEQDRQAEEARDLEFYRKKLEMQKDSSLATQKEAIEQGLKLRPKEKVSPGRSPAASSSRAKDTRTPEQKAYDRRFQELESDEQKILMKMSAFPTDPQAQKYMKENTRDAIKARVKYILGDRPGDVPQQPEPAKPGQSSSGTSSPKNMQTRDLVKNASEQLRRTMEEAKKQKAINTPISSPTQKSGLPEVPTGTMGHPVLDLLMGAIINNAEERQRIPKVNSPKPLYQDLPFGANKRFY